MEFISNVYAQSAPAEAVPGQAPSRALMDMLPILAIFVIFFFLMVRPRLKEEKKRKQMLNEIKRGDEVMTMSGIYGKIAEVAEGHFMVQVANNVTIKVDKQAIQSRSTQSAPAKS